jgi:hypothetical protein
MPDYYPLLQRAIGGLERNTRETREAVYGRAREALLKQLRGVAPPLAEAEVTRERLALEDAIRRIDGEVTKKEAEAAPQRPAAPPKREPPRPPQPPQRPPVPPRPPARAPTMRPPAAAPADAESRAASAPVDLDAAPASTAARPAAPVPAEAAAAPGPRAFRPGAGKSMRKDERRALQAKLLVGGLVLLLLVAAVALGYQHRARIAGLLGLGAPSLVTDGKVADRVTAPTTAPRAPAPAPTSPVVPVGQRAALYEENPGGGQQLQTFVGTAVWRTETVSPGPDRLPDVGVRVDIDIPDRKMTAVMTIRRNPDAALPATHMIEIQFNTPNDPFGGVATLPGLRMKVSETAQGTPLAALVVRVMPGFFLVGLSAIDVDRESNIQAIRERPWFDIPFVYNNGRRAVLAFEKGTPGERAINEALAAWSKK